MCEIFNVLPNWFTAITSLVLAYLAYQAKNEWIKPEVFTVKKEIIRCLILLDKNFEKIDEIAKNNIRWSNMTGEIYSLSYDSNLNRINEENNKIMLNLESWLTFLIMLVVEKDKESIQQAINSLKNSINPKISAVISSIRYREMRGNLIKVLNNIK